MLSKPSTVVLPLVLLLCAWWKRGRWRRAEFYGPRRSLGWRRDAPLTIIEQRGHVLRAGPAGWQLAPGDGWPSPGEQIWFYAGKVLWPAYLMFVYPRWDV